MKLVQKGGAKAMNTPDTGLTFLILFFIALFSLFIRGFLVYFTFNAIGPKLLENHGGDATNFRPITMVEAIFLVILVQNLVN